MSKTINPNENIETITTANVDIAIKEDTAETVANGETTEINNNNNNTELSVTNGVVGDVINEETTEVNNNNNNTEPSVTNDVVSNVINENTAATVTNGEIGEINTSTENTPLISFPSDVTIFVNNIESPQMLNNAHLVTYQEKTIEGNVTENIQDIPQDQSAQQPITSENANSECLRNSIISCADKSKVATYIISYDSVEAPTNIRLIPKAYDFSDHEKPTWANDSATVDQTNVRVGAIDNLPGGYKLETYHGNFAEINANKHAFFIEKDNLSVLFSPESLSKPEFKEIDIPAHGNILASHFSQFLSNDWEIDIMSGDCPHNAPKIIEQHDTFECNL